MATANTGKPCSVAGCTNICGSYNVTGMCGWHSVRKEKGLPLIVPDTPEWDAEMAREIQEGQNAH